MTLDELSAMNETNLFHLMSNEVVAADLRLQAAVHLYQRGSRFTTFAEFQNFRPRVLDFILSQTAEKSVSFMPNPTADQIGRLHQRAESLQSGITAAVDGAAEGDLAVSRSLENHVQNFDTHVQAVTSHLQTHTETLEEVSRKVDENATVVQQSFEAVDAVLDLQEQVAEETSTSFQKSLENLSGIQTGQEEELSATAVAIGELSLKTSQVLRHLFWTQIVTGVIVVAQTAVLLSPLFYGARS